MSKHCDMCGAEVPWTFHVEPDGVMRVSRPMEVCTSCLLDLEVKAFNDIAQGFIDECGIEVDE